MIEVCSTNKCCRSFAGGEQTPAPAPAPAKWGKTPAPVHSTKKAVQMSSFEFMKRNEQKFAEARFLRYRNGVCGLPTDQVVSKVVSGSVTQGRELMDEKTKEIIRAKWLEVVGQQIGFQDYDELRMLRTLRKYVASL